MDVKFPDMQQSVITPKPGLKVAVERRDALTEVFALLVPVGALSEGPGEEGYAHLLEHMIFRGTKDYPTTMDILGAVEGMGGRINAFTTYDYMVVMVQVPLSSWKVGLEVMWQLVAAPLLREEDLAVEKEVVLREIDMLMDDPSEVAGMLLQKAMWNGHRMGLDVIGLADVVAGATARRLRDFWERCFLRSPWTMVAVGGLSPEDVGQAIDGLEDPRDASVIVHPWDRLSTAGFVGETVRNSKETQQTYLRVAVETYPYRTAKWNESKYALSFISAFLGGASFSRLMMEIREKRGWAYSLGSTVSGSVAGGSMVWSFDLKTGVWGDVLDFWRAEVDRLTSGDVTDEEFDAIVRYLIGSTMTSFDNMWNSAMAHLLALAYYDRLWNPRMDVDRLAGLSLSDVSLEASRIFNSGVAMALYGPMSDVLN